MIWNSVWWMTVFDLLFLGVVAYAFAIFLGYRRRLPAGSRGLGNILLLAGIAVLSLFYVGDLVSMHVLPLFIPRADAMEAMRQLHLEYRWYTSLIGVALLVFGFAVMMRNALRLREELADREQRLTAEAEALHKSEDALRESEQRYRSIFDMGPMGMTLLDREHRFLAVNRQFADMLGYSESELVGRTFIELTHPEDIERTLKTADAGLAGAVDRISYTKRYIHKSGHMVHARVTAAPVRDADGNPIYGLAIIEDLTAARQTEAELERARATMETAIEQSPAGFIMVDANDPDLRIGNPAAHLVRGERGKEGLTKPYRARPGKTFHPDGTEWPPTDLPVNHAIRDGTITKNAEMRVIGEDGVERWVLVNAAPVRDLSGEIIAGISVFLDITERKKTEQELERARALLTAAFEQSPSGMVIIDAENHSQRMANPAAFKMRGATKTNGKPNKAKPDFEARPGNTYRFDGSVLPFEELPSSLALTEGKVFENAEVVIRGEDGVDRYVLANASPVRNSDGEIIAAIAVFTDITERRKTEEELERTRALLSAAIEQSPAGIIIADAHDQTRRIANHAALEIRGDGDSSGDTVALPLDSNFKKWKSYHADGSAFAYDDLPLSRALLRGEESRNVNVIVRNDDGRERWTVANAAPILGPDGDVTAGIVVFTDVTEDKRRETELREKDQHLAEVQSQLLQVARVSAMGELSSAIAHELNQPLAAIMNYAQVAHDLIADEIDPEENRAAEFLDKAGEQAERAAKVITRLRSLYERGDAAHHAEDLGTVLDEAMSLALLGNKDPELNLSLKLPKKLPAVSIDKVQIQQATINLVRNAIEAMQCSDRRDLVVDAGVRKGKVHVNVRDTGPGLPMEVKNQVFDPFVTTRKKGMGLGLSIARTIVEAHGGELIARSRKGTGTTFSFDLPVASTDSGER